MDFGLNSGQLQSQKVFAKPAYFHAFTAFSLSSDHVTLLFHVTRRLSIAIGNEQLMAIDTCREQQK